MQLLLEQFQLVVGVQLLLGEHYHLAAHFQLVRTEYVVISGGHWAPVLADLESFSTFQTTILFLLQVFVRFRLLFSTFQTIILFLLQVFVRFRLLFMFMLQVLSNFYIENFQQVLFGDHFIIGDQFPLVVLFQIVDQHFFNFLE